MRNKKTVQPLLSGSLMAKEGFGSLDTMLRNAVQTKWPKKYDIADFSQDTVLLRPAWDSSERLPEGQYYSVDYAVNKGVVTFVGDIKKVRREISYIPVEGKVEPEMKTEQPVFNTWRGASFANQGQPSVGLKGAQAITLRGTFFITPSKTYGIPPTAPPGVGANKAFGQPGAQGPQAGAPDAQGQQGAQAPSGEPAEFQLGDPIVWKCDQCGYEEEGIYDGTDTKECPKCGADMMPYPPEEKPEVPFGKKKKAVPSGGAGTQAPPEKPPFKKVPPPAPGESLYNRYRCGECGAVAVSESWAGLLSCPMCDGMMIRAERTMLLKGEALLEKRIIETPQGTIRFYVSAAYKAEGRSDLLEHRVSENKGIVLVFAQRRNNSRIFETLFFDFDISKGWDEAKVNSWMKEHGFVVRVEFSQNLYHIPVAMRKLFDNNISLAAEWRDYYIRHIEDEFPALSAWAEFKRIYVKDEKKGWMRKLD